ncbi:MAG: hypothetical protein QN141_03435 [Armatimonadota bacterium]|nr:hypothetical protein [Armatimonadota bacterium]MDR7451396.1 hypothetical protein [Armatimonadota bacterium]MDR7466454.1 hypothetical protein [Armatimonadota bacterium]MDR7493176.1 hypothetical protein [Armatimonadota bacterium]MDR7499471.1 hypothetical protein [Armatimonadota bacterium]
MRRHLTSVVVIVAAGIALAACGGKSAQPGPRFASVVLTDNPESKTEKTIFAPDTPRIYVVFTLAAVAQGTAVKSVWIAEKTGVADLNTKIDEAMLTMGGAQTSGRFWYSRPTNGWPVGEYRVELYIGEQQAATRRFRIEGQATSTPAAPVPFASKGWTLENDVYVNQRHGLRIAVPEGWKTGDEARFSKRILWVMSKLDGAGRERMGVNITHVSIGQADAEEFLNSDLESFKQATYEEDGATKSLFTVLETGQIGSNPAVHFIRNSDQSRGLSLYSARNGFGYIVIFKWAADAATEDLSQLQSVARSIGYGDLPFATAGPGAPGAVSPPASPPAATPAVPSTMPAAPSPRSAGVDTGTPIVFATGVQNAKPVGAASTFPTGTRRVDAFVRYQHLRREDRLDGIWFRDDRQFMRQSTTGAEIFGGGTIPPSGRVWFWVEWKEGAPAGSYRFELQFNGQAITQGTFEIR